MSLTFATTASRSRRRRLTISPKSAENGIPAELQGCHTAFLDDYVVDGHVPIEAIDKLLAEHPAVKGITLPGMPAGSPGMFGEKIGRLTIYAIGQDVKPGVFMML